MEKYILLLVAGLNTYLCYRFVTDNVWAREYVEKSPKAWIWRKLFGKDKALKIIRKFFVPIGILISVICVIIFFSIY